MLRPMLLERDFREAPSGGNGVGRFLAIGDLAPATIVQPRMSKLVRDDVASECFGASFKAWLQHHAATETTRSQRRHHDRAASTGLAIVERDSKRRIAQKVLLHVSRKTLKHRFDVS